MGCRGASGGPLWWALMGGPIAGHLRRWGVPCRMGGRAQWGVQVGLLPELPKMAYLQAEGISAVPEGEGLGDGEVAVQI